MKKLIFAIVAIATFSFASCTGKATSTEVSSTDSLEVVSDSTSMITDSTLVDSVEVTEVTEVK